MRRFPPPWTLEALDGGGFKVVDSHGQSLAYVYGHFDPHDAETAKGLTLDEARRIASNIAFLTSASSCKFRPALPVGCIVCRVASPFLRTDTWDYLQRGLQPDYR
jgi:hypothetical protein